MSEQKRYRRKSAKWRLGLFESRTKSVTSERDRTSPTLCLWEIHAPSLRARWALGVCPRPWFVTMHCRANFATRTFAQIAAVTNFASWNECQSSPRALSRTTTEPESCTSSRRACLGSIAFAFGTTVVPGNAMAVQKQGAAELDFQFYMQVRSFRGAPVPCHASEQASDAASLWRIDIRIACEPRYRGVRTSDVLINPACKTFFRRH